MQSASSCLRLKMLLLLTLYCIKYPYLNVNSNSVQCSFTTEKSVFQRHQAGRSVAVKQVPHIRRLSILEVAIQGSVPDTKACFAYIQFIFLCQFYVEKSGNYCSQLSPFLLSFISHDELCLLQLFIDRPGLFSLKLLKWKLIQNF